MRLADAPRRSTVRSNALEFYLRIFDVCSWDVENEELAGAGDDGPPWQTSAAILPPQEGLHLRSKKRRVWQ